MSPMRLLRDEVGMKLTHDIVLWTFEHYVTLAEGNWPEPKTDDTGVRPPGVSYHAPFESPCIAAAEVSSRVRCCGTDGLLVELVYGMLTGNPIPIETVSKKRHMAADYIQTRINKVAWYCTDSEWVKGLTYDAWKKASRGNRKYRIPMEGIGT